MNKAASGNRCLSTCFGVGGDEEVWGVRTKSPNRVPVVGDVVHERNSSDGYEGEASDRGAGLLNGLAIGHLLLLCHDWNSPKFGWGNQKAEFANCEAVIAVLLGGPFSSRFLVLCETLKADLLLYKINSKCLQTASCLIVRPKITAYISWSLSHYLLSESLSAGQK